MKGEYQIGVLEEHKLGESPSYTPVTVSNYKQSLAYVKRNAKSWEYLVLRIVDTDGNPIISAIRPDRKAGRK